MGKLTTQIDITGRSLIDTKSLELLYQVTKTETWRGIYLELPHIIARVHVDMTQHWVVFNKDGLLYCFACGQILLPKKVA